jgi:hypothetical protein
MCDVDDDELQQRKQRMLHMPLLHVQTVPETNIAGNSC